MKIIVEQVCEGQEKKQKKKAERRKQRLIIA
jgi:hypothetical protein